MKIPLFRHVNLSIKKLKLTKYKFEQESSPVLISADEVIGVRHEVLRKGKPIATAIFDGDHLTDAFHLGIKTTSGIVAVASYLPHPHPEFATYNKPYQLRGMAVLPDFRGKHLGKKMYLKALEILKEKQAGILWFNAREAAAGFYESLGAKKWGSDFFIPEIGKHFLMYQIIDPCKEDHSWEKH